MATAWFCAIVERAADGYGVYFPDLPGCTSYGRTVSEAIGNAEEALSLHLAGMIEDGDRIPDPTAPELVQADPESDVVAKVIARAELPGKAVRINITMDEGLLSAVDNAAGRASTSRSGFLADAVRQYLRR